MREREKREESEERRERRERRKRGARMVGKFRKAAKEGGSYKQS